MNKQRGFSMLGVLISMLISTFAVLGIAGMQLLAIKNTDAARYNSLATMLASSMATKMQANILYWGSPPATVTINGASVTNGPPALGSGVTCLNSACTAAQMARYDLNNWGTDMANGLPAGQGTIGCTASTPAVCTLTISWSETNIALYNPTGTETGALASGTTATHNFKTIVSIPIV